MLILMPECVCQHALPISTLIPQPGCALEHAHLSHLYLVNYPTKYACNFAHLANTQTIKQEDATQVVQHILYNNTRIIQQTNVYRNAQVILTTFHRTKHTLAYSHAPVCLPCLLITQREDVLNFAQGGTSKLLLTIRQESVCLYALMEHICRIQLAHV